MKPGMLQLGPRRRRGRGRRHPSCPSVNASPNYQRGAQPDFREVGNGLGTKRGATAEMAWNADGELHQVKAIAPVDVRTKKR